MKKVNHRTCLTMFSNFRFRLHSACELAKKNMSVVQSKMKSWFDRRAKSRSFNPGDQVLLLLPVPGSALEACYRGPYTVKEKVNERNYVVATPDRKRRSR